MRLSRDLSEEAQCASYDAAGRISDSEAVELVGEVRELQALVAAWLAEHYPGYCREP